jgi:multimeric flavodoxin WrbA
MGDAYFITAVIKREAIMNIVVINGSPAGNRGVTAQSVNYLQQQFPEHRFEVVEVARRIRRIERDEELMAAIVEQIVQADAILWAFPVYLMLVPAQMKRFIELLFERIEPDALAGKVASAISTSAHHYDHTAHDYLQGISSDLGLAYVRGFSADYRDLLGEEGRHNLRGFGREFLLHAAGEAVVESPVPPVVCTPPAYEPALPPRAPRTVAGRVVVIDDSEPDDHNLRQMIEVFERSVALPVDRIELRSLRMDGGCLGCMRCADGADCVYRDEYAAAFDERVRRADVIIYAGAIRDRFLSARMKTFIDRYFSNGHRPVLAGAAMGFLVSGPLQQLATLREVIEAHIECGCGQRLGVVTDEQAGATTSQLVAMARATERWLGERWYTPQTFRAVGAIKNFRDLVYSNRGLMSADHRYYRDHGLYDSPDRTRLGDLFQAALLLCRRIPPLNRWLKREMLGGKMRAYRKVLAAE